MAFLGAEGVEQVGLFLGFHAFGDGEQVQVAGHGDDVADERADAWVVLDLGDEGQVQFEDVDRQSGQAGQVRIAGAEVVDGAP